MRTPRLGMIVALCAVLIAIWLTAVYGTYKEAQIEKYDVRVHPGAVSYGTHSSATIPMVSAPGHQTSVPMISGGAIRSYAHYGHAGTANATSGGYQLHTTSSATVHTVGSGGGASGSSSPSGDRGASSRGITYGGTSVSMPTLALATPSYASKMTTSTRFAGPRRAKPSDSGSEGDWQNGGGGDTDWWYWDDWAGDEGDWVAASVGDLRPAGDGINYYQYEGGGKWTLVDNQGNPVNPSPIGDAPWLWTILLAAAYGIVKMIRKKQNAI